MDARGVRFVVSYADCTEARELLKGWTTIRVRVRRHVAGFAASRRTGFELLATNIGDSRYQHGRRSVKAKLDQVSVDLVRPNPDNPRLMFRQAELDELQESIRIYGVQVPIAVFRMGATTPLSTASAGGDARQAQPEAHSRTDSEKPSPLQNLLLMFNIHALREQWDYLTIAMKLPQVIALLKRENKKEPTEAEISSATGFRVAKFDDASS